MIRIVHSGTDGEGDAAPSAATTWRVEWDRQDRRGQELPPNEYVARFVTTFGTVSRRVRLRLSEDPGA